MSNISIESTLCDELKAYCEQHGLEYLSADELQINLISSEDAANAVHIAWLDKFIDRWEAWENADALINRLHAAYPSIEFDMVSKESVSETADSVPLYLVAFTHNNVCIVDPLTFGFGACDPVVTYGLQHEDAQAIRDFNNVVAG